MTELSLVSDKDLLDRMPRLVTAERGCTVDVIVHLMEIDRRRLYLDAACRSLSCYCIERLGLSEDEAAKRVRVARVARRIPQVLEELRSGAIHLTGLWLLTPFLTDDTASELLASARGKTRREIEELLARRFPKPDLPTRVCPEPEQQPMPMPMAILPAQGFEAATATAATPEPAPARAPVPAPAPAAAPAPALAPAPTAALPLATRRNPAKVAPLSESRWSVQLSISAELKAKIDEAERLLSHAVPKGDLAALFERAFDALLTQEKKRRFGADKPRKRRASKRRSRHIPVRLVREITERDGGQCTFVDEHGNRCSAREHLTIEHRHPFAKGGSTSAENLCLLCSAHNGHSARKEFGEAHVDEKILEAEYERTRTALSNMGFRDGEIRKVLASLKQTSRATRMKQLIVEALALLVPPAGTLKVRDSSRPRWSSSAAVTWPATVNASASRVSSNPSPLGMADEASHSWLPVSSVSTEPCPQHPAWTGNDHTFAGLKPASSGALAWLGANDPPWRATRTGSVVHYRERVFAIVSVNRIQRSAVAA